MVNRIRRWAASEKSWPILLFIIALAYWLSPQSWWSTVTFLVIGVFYLGLVAAHTIEFLNIQRKTPYLLFAIAKLFFGLALLVGALITAPQHFYGLSGLRMVSRVLWFVGLPFWGVAVYSECWRVWKLWKAQSE